MNMLIYSLLFLDLAFTQALFFDADKARENYVLAVSDQSVCKMMIADLQGKKESSLALGYLGAYQAIWANHAWNPVEKFITFRKGRANIERAIRMEPDEVELHFIRLTIQQGVPRMLNYRSEIPADKKIVLENFKKIKSGELRKLIRDFFAGNDLLTAEEKSYLQ